ncbi:MAG: tetratricopeptide repeat protein [Planctomycetes bacterium]|nr:tetratricopeptide repeat protein [Planctomycetota bacterium]
MDHHGGHYDYGHHWFPHFSFYISPWYGGYGYSSYSPVYYSGSYYSGYHTDERASASPTYVVAQAEPSPTQQVAARPVTTPEGEAFQRKAESAFRAGDFERAARLANHALVEMPRHGKLLLFTAQTLFAVGDYRSAAAAIHQAASQLDSEQWGHVVENARQYYRGHAFVDQMDRLNEYIKKNPDADYAYFLRGYQHGFLGHHQTAVRDLNKAVELESRDKLAALLIERFGGTPPAASDQPAGELSLAIDPVPSSTVPENRAERSPESTKTIEPAD